ncbi:hypothetical protein ACVDFE_07415 [Lentzea chajnantorensis]
MPEVVPITAEKPGFLDFAGGALTGPAGIAHVIGQQRDHERQEAAADNAAAQAVKVMEDYQADSRWNSSTLGEFPDPPQIVIDTPPPGQTGTHNQHVGYTPTGVSSPTGTGTNTGTTTPSWTAPPTGTVSPTPTWTPPGDTTHTSWTTPSTTTTPPTTHLPPTTLPTPEPKPTPTPGPGPVFTRPATGGPGGGRSGPGGTGGVRGGQLGGGKAFGPMSGSLGASGQGVGAGQGGLKAGVPGMGPDALRPGGTGAAGGPGGVAGKAGAAGGAGMGAGGAHGAKGEGEDDIEHKVADYLVETDDVFGDDRMIAPPVIGGLSE